MKQFVDNMEVKTNVTTPCMPISVKQSWVHEVTRKREPHLYLSSVDRNSISGISDYR